MSREQAGKPLTSHPQQAQRPLDSPYLTSHECVCYLRLGSLSSLYDLVRDHKLPTRRVGRNYRFYKPDVDAWTAGFGSALELVRSLKAST